MTVAELQKKLRRAPKDAVVVLAAHDAVTGKACGADMICEDDIRSWNEDTNTDDFNPNMFVISS